jgi:hypothetical protein
MPTDRLTNERRSCVKSVTIKARPFIPAGRVHVMPDIAVEGISLSTTTDEAQHLVIDCHPGDEQRVADALAIEQQRPNWWQDLTHFEQVMRNG